MTRLQERKGFQPVTAGLGTRVPWERHAVQKEAGRTVALGVGPSSAPSKLDRPCHLSKYNSEEHELWSQMTWVSILTRPLTGASYLIPLCLFPW